MSVEKASKEEYQFFGNFEKHPRGGYTSDMPSWCFERQVEGLKEELAAKEEALSVPGVAKQRPELTLQVRELKQRIHDIESSKPKLTAKQKDDLAAVRAELLETIKDRGYSRSDMKSGRADAHKLLAQMETPFIPLRKDIADACGVTLRNGKATRDGAAKAWKIISRAIEADSNSHLLYKDER